LLYLNMTGYGHPSFVLTLQQLIKYFEGEGKADQQYKRRVGRRADRQSGVAFVLDGPLLFYLCTPRESALVSTAIIPPERMESSVPQVVRGWI